jgi:hypothetical protein
MKGEIVFPRNQKPMIAPLLALCALAAGCPATDAGTGAVKTASTSTATPSASPSSGATTASVTSGPAAVQIILATGSAASFNAASVPASGGTYVAATRAFDLSGNLITNYATTYPNWWFQDAGVYLTSTSTSYPGGGSGATTSNSTDRELTPCAYFDSTDDNNPESAGYFTIDGLTTNAPSLTDTTPSADIDQCAGITAAERSRMGLYVRIRRSSASMGTNEKIQMIVKAKPLTTPNTAPVPSSCIVGGLFDATACATNVFTLSMRTAVTAAARPLYMLMPSAKALDLISESIMLPVNIDSTITALTIDRLKGGAVFYSIVLVKVP